MSKKIPTVPIAKAAQVKKIPAAFAKGVANTTTNYGPAIPKLPKKNYK